jgi:hypothetical protein
LRDTDTIFRLGACGAVGAVAGVLCGLVVADLTAQAFGDPFQFYHFAVVLAFVGAGIATGTLIADVVSREQTAPDVGSILTAATFGSASAVTGCVIAQELLPFSRAPDFATIAWGSMGGFLGWTIAMLVDRYSLIRAACGGMIGGVAVGWMFFDPAAQLVDIVMETAVLGFLIPAIIVLSQKGLHHARARASPSCRSSPLRSP